MLIEGENLVRSGFIKRRFGRWWRQEAGDTLIEVTMALAILSLVLTSSSVIAAKAFQLGQTAGERTKLVEAAQAQIENVRAFRDSHTWDAFLNGYVSGNPNTGSDTWGQRSNISYTGVLNTARSTNCHDSTPCLHMEPRSGVTYLPSSGMIDGPVPGSFIQLQVDPEPVPNPTYVHVTVSYGFNGLDGNDYLGHIRTTYTNLSQVVVPPAPPAPVCDPVRSDVVLLLDTSGSMGDEWYGSTREAELKQVAKSMVNEMNVSPSTNLVGVVGFSGTAQAVQPLSGNPAAINSAIDGLTLSSGTVYSKGLQAAQDMLTAPSSYPQAKKVIVMVSDGRPDDVINDASATQQVVMNAVASLPTGTVLYTIGIAMSGQDLSVITNMPINGGFYGDAQNPSLLQSITSGIASEVVCGNDVPVAAMPTPTPAPTPTPTATSTPSPTPDGGAAIGTTDCTPLPECLNGQMVGGSYQFYDGIYNRSPLGQQVTGCVWDWGDGTKTVNESCNPGDIEWHQWPTLTNLAPYPQDCPPIRGDGVVDYKVVLTLYLANGLAPQSNTYLEPSPVCY